MPRAAFEREPRRSLLGGLGLIFLAVFLVLAYSRVLEVVFDNAFRLPLIVGGAAALCAVFSGQWHVVGRSWAARLMVAYALWFVACIPFAYWRAGSLEILTDRFSKSILVFLTVALLIVSARQLRGIYAVLLVSVTLAIALTIPYGANGDGRLAMMRGELANSNQLAMVALIGLPFVLSVVLDVTRIYAWRVLAGGAAAWIAITILRTGSRTGMLGLILFGILLFAVLPAAGRVVTLIAALLGLVLAIVLLPGQLAVRLGSVFSNDDDMITVQDAEVLNSSRESSANRMQVIKEGLRYTAENPLFGLGPGNFVERRNKDYQDRYGHQGYLAAHNSYVQTASEMGVIGFLLFTSILVVSYRTAARIYRLLKMDGSAEGKRIRGLALTLRLCVVMLALFSFFNHIAYDLYIPTVVGLLVALEGIAAFHGERLAPNWLRRGAFPTAAPEPVLAAAEAVRPQNVQPVKLAASSSQNYRFGRLRRPASQQGMNGETKS